MHASAVNQCYWGEQSDVNFNGNVELVKAQLNYLDKVVERFYLFVLY